MKINGEEISNTLLNKSPVEIGVTLTTDCSILFLWFNGYIYNPGVTTQSKKRLHSHKLKGNAHILLASLNFVPLVGAVNIDTDLNLIVTKLLSKSPWR